MTNTEKNLVSVIIPCYNAETWIAEAVDSVLKQSAQSVEIIVVDDGSTDGSRTVLEKYGKQIQLICQSNSGGSAARNAGFRQSRGEFIQFLDADDFLLPEKIKHQQDYLIEADKDVVYSDWQFQHHAEDHSVWLRDPTISGDQKDVLYSLLRGWWVSSAAILFRRSVIEAVNGWDESLPAAQDRDFFTRIAMQTRRIGYLPGCETIYRRHGNVTVSTNNHERFINSHLKINVKLESLLANAGLLDDHYRQAIGRSYFWIARFAYDKDPSLAVELANRSIQIAPSFTPGESFIYDFLFKTIGFDKTEKVARLRRWLANNTVNRFVKRDPRKGCKRIA